MKLEGHILLIVVPIVLLALKGAIVPNGFGTSIPESGIYAFGLGAQVVLKAYSAG